MKCGTHEKIYGRSLTHALTTEYERAFMATVFTTRFWKQLMARYSVVKESHRMIRCGSEKGWNSYRTLIKKGVTCSLALPAQESHLAKQ